jgi:triacylglycerol esterase/lipase EstA (alpha/beta hydrolase family)
MFQSLQGGALFHRADHRRADHREKLTLERRWALENEQPFQTMEESTLATLKERHILIVAGFLNELSVFDPMKYRASASIVRDELGATASCFFPSSFLTAIENADALEKKVRKIHQKTNKAVVLLGHSKGGAEVLFTLLKYPQLILDGVVDRAILVQAALGGSPLAAKESPHLMVRCLQILLGRGLNSLTQERADASLSEMIEEFRGALKEGYSNATEQELCEMESEISSRIFYVRSYAETAQLSEKVRFALGLLEADLSPYGKNDGILLTDDQISKEIGIDLGVIQSDHMSLVSSPDLEGGDGAQQVRGFTRALFQQVYEDCPRTESVNHF